MANIKHNIVLTTSEVGVNPASNAVAPRVSKWSTSFETLLADPAGLHSFAEFLKQEYSHENIYFWTACERYKRAENADMRKCLAREIYSRHMADEALMPVNVDAGAHKIVTNLLDSPDEKLYIEPQEQVFKLMKYDSYSRFIKSSLFKVCEIRDQRQQHLPYPGDHTMDLNLRTDKALMSPVSDQESHRRRSTSFSEGHLIADKVIGMRAKQSRHSTHEEGRNKFSLSPRGSRKAHKVPNYTDDTEMYENLKITDKQLDDQRGTHINFEMPDFLKNHNPKSAPNDSVKPPLNDQRGTPTKSVKSEVSKTTNTIPVSKDTHNNTKSVPKDTCINPKFVPKDTHKNLDDQRGTAINSEMPEFLKNNNAKSNPKGTNPPKLK